jgi:hypothetical protein
MAQDVRQSRPLDLLMQRWQQQYHGALPRQLQQFILT